MVIGKIKCSFPECDLLFSLDESMKVHSPILVGLLSYDILSDSVLLLKVL